MALFGYSNTVFYPEDGGLIENKYLHGFCKYGIKTYIVPEGVETIEAGFFQGRNGIETIVLPKTLTAIPPRCFSDCSGLKSIMIPNSVLSIGYNAFDGCKSLTTITIPSSVKSIGNYAFHDCESLQTVILNSPISEISSSVFSGCKSLANITLPMTVVKIGDSAFYACSNLKSIQLPQSLKEICSRSFSCCGLTSITIPSSVTSIGEDAFNFCDNLNQVALPNSLTEIADSAFSFCKALNKIIFPNSLKRIGNKAFWFCKNLTSLELPMSLEEIGESAFSSCDKLTAVSFGNRIRTIGKGAFSICGFKHVRLPSSLINADENDFNSCSVTKNCKYGSIVKDDVIIAEGTTTIRPHAFEGANVKTITFPDSVTEICEYAFANCKDIEITRIPSRLKSIGTRAFSHCEISRIALPGTVEFIGSGAFREGTVVTINGVDADEWWKRIEFKKGQTDEQNTIRLYKQKITDCESQILVTANNIRDKEGLLSEKETLLCKVLTEMPDYQKRFDEAKVLLDSNSQECGQIVSTAQSELERLNEEKAQLEKELKDTFFLSFSKRNSISQQISSKNLEIGDAEEQLSAATEHMNIVLEPLKAEVASAEAAYMELVEKNRNLQSEIEELKKNKETIVQKKEKLEKQYRELLKSLETAEENARKNEAARTLQLETLREKAAEREEKLRLTAKQKQKRELLGTLNLKIEDIERSKSAIPEEKHTNPDEVLLNESYAGLINWENKCRTAEQMEKFLKINQKELEKLKELNLSLGLEENDGLLSLPEDESIQEWTTNDFPSRIASLSKLFMQEGSWKHLKNLLRSKKQTITDARHRTFFTGRELALLLCDKNTTLVFLPYCVVGYAAETDMWQMFYDDLQITMKCEEFESTKANKGCEEIGNHYLHETKDGGKDMRFSSNPLIHQWRKTTVTIKSRKARYTCVASTKSEAEELKDLFEVHTAVLNNPAYTNTYSAIKAFKSVEEIESTLASYREQQKQQLKSKKEKLAAEKEKAKREDAERRRKLIAKQRERNTEKRFDEISASTEEITTGTADWEAAPAAFTATSTEKNSTQVITSVAEALQNADADFSVESEYGLILTSKSRTVFNNIFSLDFVFHTGPETGRAPQSRSVLMTDAAGNAVSEIMTVSISNEGNYHVTMTLKPRSFNKNDRFYLAVINDSLDSVESLTAFKINIAFSNLFDNDFGL